MDSRIGLEGCRKSRLHRGSIPGPHSPYRVAIPAQSSQYKFKMRVKFGTGIVFGVSIFKIIGNFDTNAGGEMQKSPFCERHAHSFLVGQCHYVVAFSSQ